ncbi:MAG: hypothetical protein Q8939_08795 [Bacteroidota bacterium]|nr:hypothetical protein [Bacteroidota bacterium]
MTTACTDQPGGKESKKDSAYEKGSFGYDLSFLRSHDDVMVLSDSGNQAMIIVSAKYQGKVFTSTASGNEGQSFGWVNYKAFTGAPNTHMNGYGGENRLWLGPEGGKYSLFFPKGAKMDFDNWKTPAAFDTEAWEVVSKDSQEVSLRKNMDLRNYAGSDLQISVDRIISIINRSKIFSTLNLEPDDSVKAVGSQAQNKITNAGKFAWNDKTGMPCIWMLDMFNPSEKTVILVPYRRPSDTTSKIATTNYFGEIPADRLKHRDGILYFKADGKSRGKLGLDPSRATHFVGSYDAIHHILTIAHFDLDSSAKYLNQEWNTTKPAFSGDAVNAYNDGPLADGTQMGPFYEIESVSPAAILKPGESLQHQHSVFHFTGSEPALNKITESVFHISIDQIKSAF